MEAFARAPAVAAGEGTATPLGLRRRFGGGSAAVAAAAAAAAAAALFDVTSTAGAGLSLAERFVRVGRGGDCAFVAVEEVASLAFGSSCDSASLLAFHESDGEAEEDEEDRATVASDSAFDAPLRFDCGGSMGDGGDDDAAEEDEADEREDRAAIGVAVVLVAPGSCIGTSC